MSEVHVVEQLLEALPTPKETDQLLAAQFRALVRGTQMTPEKWNQLMDRYIAGHPMRHLMDPDAEKLERENFERALMQPTMTWRMFCKGLDFLNVKDVCMFVNVKTHEGLSASTATNFSFAP